MNWGSSARMVSLWMSVKKLTSPSEMTFLLYQALLSDEGCSAVCCHS